MMTKYSFIDIVINIMHIVQFVSFSASTLLVRRQEGHPACETLGDVLLVVMI